MNTAWMDTALSNWNFQLLVYHAVAIWFCRIEQETAMRLRSHGQAQGPEVDEALWALEMARALADEAGMAALEAHQPSGDDDSQAEVEVVERHEADPLSGEDDDDDGLEVEFVGAANVQNLAHPRPACTIHLFATTDHRLYCDRCYCLPCFEWPGRCPCWNLHCHSVQTVQRSQHRSI
jgi:hypothetical protein